MNIPDHHWAANDKIISFIIDVKLFKINVFNKYIIQKDDLPKNDK